MTILVLAVGSISIVGVTQVAMASQIGKLCVIFTCGNANITGGTSGGGGGGAGGQPTPTTGKLTVIKEIDGCTPGTAGCKVPSDFQIQVSGNNPTPSNSFPGSTTGTEVTLDPGQFKVTETLGQPGFLITFKGNCQQDTEFSTSATGNINAGDSLTCTVVNSLSGPPGPP